MTSQTPVISLKCFQQISLSDKTKAIQNCGVPLIGTQAHGLHLFLYSIHDYFVEVTTLTSGEVLSIRATDDLKVLELYLQKVDISGVASTRNPAK